MSTPDLGIRRGSQLSNVWTLLVLMLLCIGCGPQELEDTQVDPIIVSDATGNADLKQGIDFLNRMEEFNPQQIQSKVIGHLQQWLDKQPPPPGWSVDPITRQMQQGFSAMVSAERLSSNALEPYDLFVLQEATWLRDLSRTLSKNPQLDPALAKRIGASEFSNTLLLTTRVFDWVARNLQTDADVQPGDTHRMNSDLILNAWESLLMGRGTSEEKSRIFLLIARQLRIPVVMLSVLSSDGTVQAWLPAAWVDGKLYLFDMRLGTPIPGPNGVGIATWKQVVESPELLSSLGTPERPYRLPAEAIPNVVALIDATPAYLSKRMKLLENVLTGDDKMILSVSPTALAEELIAKSGVNQVGIWDLPYRAFAIRSQMTPQSNGYLQLLSEHNLLEMTPLKIARVLHFRGQYEATEEQSGALNLYLDARTSRQQLDQMVANLPTAAAIAAEMDEDLQRQRAEHVARVRNLEGIMRRSTENGSHWMGLLSFDRGRYKLSADYLQKRLLAKSPNTVWQHGAIYNLGRAYEALAEKTDDESIRAQAMEAYQRIESGPNYAACAYHARRLQPGNLEVQPSSESAPETDTDSNSPPAAEQADAGSTDAGSTDAGESTVEDSAESGPEVEAPDVEILGDDNVEVPSADE